MTSTIEFHDDLGSTTWAARNPEQPIQPTRMRPSKSTSRSDASMGTRNLLKKNTKAHLDLAQEAVSAYLEEQKKFIDDVSQRYLVDKECVRKMITHASTYTPTRGPSLSNAILHRKSKELNEDRIVGNRLKLKDIQEAVDKDTDLDALSMSKQRQKELIDELIDHRMLKSQGSRSNNRAAALDAHQNIKAITLEMRNLFLRTGVRSFAFFSRSHAEDTTTTFTATSDDTVLKFFPEVLKLDYTDVLAKFEMHACLENRSVIKPDTLPSMRAECTGLVLDGLRSILVNKTVKMNYINYDMTIVEKYHVHLVGWPSRIAFGSPSKISTVDDIRLLRSALKDGECKWMFLTAEERKAHDRKLAEARMQGTLARKKRKERADKGQSRKKGNRQESKRRKTSQLPPGPAYKSAEFIDDDDEAQSDDSNGSESNDGDE
ncbi:hypothetical protein C0992_009704 [Termitomyces sp. T32_za158]|nr:hypothetical protein C0992_009704 [Termitomyces sp. T32_za158]